jgi:multidrug efflux pump subunit AcrA (membrane-fusion protein)
MRHAKAAISVLLFSLGLIVLAQDNATVQLTPVPPKPTCTQIFNTGPCADMWRNYRQALLLRQQQEIQLYVNRQKQLASEAASAPLQQQISDLNKLVADQQEQLKKLQERMQADAAAALQAKQTDSAAALAAQDAAHKQGLWLGVEIGAGSMFVLFIVIFGVRRLSRSFTITKKSQATSA